MEEIIQILIFVGAMVIAVIGQNAKNKKKPTTTSPQEVLEDTCIGCASCATVCPDGCISVYKVKIQ